jgi:hypothetical protein
MSNPFHLAVDSANRYLTDPHSTPGELIGSTLGAAYGPVGAFVGGTLGRIVERKLIG